MPTFRPGSKSSKSFELEIVVDEASLRRIDDELSAMPSKIKTAKAAAVNRTLRTGRTRLSRIVRDEVPLKKKIVDDRLTITRKATRNNRGGTLRVKSTRIPLIAFDGRPTKPPSQRGIKVAKRAPKIGAGYRLRTGGPIIRKRGSFVQRGTKTGNVHIMTRFGIGSDREPRIRYGPSVLSVLEDHGIDAIVLELTDVLDKNVTQQINRFLARARGRQAR